MQRIFVRNPLSSRGLCIYNDRAAQRGRGPAQRFGLGLGSVNSQLEFSVALSLNLKLLKLEELAAYYYSVLE